jgi:transcriptional regulator with XRE-family HTH domain
MPTRETAIPRAAARTLEILRRAGGELRIARTAAGMSSRDLGRLTGISHTQVIRIERGLAPHVDFGVIARMASALGHELAVAIHLVSAPVRDKAHIALLRRFAVRLHKSVRWRTEVPIPIPGDRRSADAVASAAAFDAVIEAETRVHDVQAAQRRLRSKQRDLDARRAILLLADTRHNRAVIDAVPEIRERFPIPTRACMAALARGEDPGGDCLVIL